MYKLQNRNISMTTEMFGILSVKVDLVIDNFLSDKGHINLKLDCKVL